MNRAKLQGFTLIEALVTLLVLAILTTLAYPAFAALIRDLRVQTATSSIIAAAHSTRTFAVKANRRATMATLDSWENGWVIFFDDNHNGELDEDEQPLHEAPELHESIEVEGNRPVADYISYLSSGESRWASGYLGGGFQAGTLTICPVEEGPGYALILARGGRFRKEKVEPEECGAS